MQQVDWAKIRSAFPIVKEQVRGQPLIYLDNAATSQKPQSVLDAIIDYYSKSNANVHRAAYSIGAKATTAYEGVRDKVAAFVHAEREEIIFTKGATEGINCVAEAFVAPLCEPGDEIIISILEHHSNIVPWQQLAKRLGVILKVVPMTQAGQIDFEAFSKMLSSKVKFCSLIHVSNVLGVVNPIERFIHAAHALNIPVLVDATQSIPHRAVDVKSLDCDFMVFSGHKMFGPTGVGVLYGKATHLEHMVPYQSGGAMIKAVSLEETTFQKPPYRFEAGTPNMAGVIGLGAAVDFIKEIGFPALEAYETMLLSELTRALQTVPGLQIIGSTEVDKVCVVSFKIEGAHGQDIAMLLDQQGIAVRAGHHCAMPLLDTLALDSLVRVSLGCYNQVEELVRLVEGLKKAQKMLVRSA